MTKPVLLPYQLKWVNDQSRFKLWVASRQIGKSFALSFEGTKDAVVDKEDVVFLSASARQSKALMKKVYRHLKAIKKLSRAEKLAAKENVEECELSNGATLVSLPANPDTARGFSANVYLDEFGIHRNSREIYTALFPSITRGYKIRIASTPMGKQGKFWEIYNRNDVYSKHTTTIEQAAAQGLNINVEELRLGLDDPEMWAQEFMCEFLDESSAFLSHDLITACEYDPDLELPIEIEGDSYLGMDIGRKKHLSVMWKLLAFANVLHSQEVKVLEKAPFRKQRKALYQRLKEVRRACIDETGLGMQLAEEAVEKFGSHKVEPVTFSVANKEAMAYGLLTKFEDRAVRIPTDRDIHNDLHSVRKVATSTGHFRFDVDHDETKGHADRFWALALAIQAASKPGWRFAYESAAKRRSYGHEKGAW
jgi:phage FluMu gp28-like protein